MKKLINKKLTLPIFIIFLIGIVSGIIFLFFISDVDKLIIKTELEEYIKLIQTNNVDKLTAFINSLKNNLIYLTLIWITSISLVFSPISLFILFYKGFLLGFLLSSHIMVYGTKGLIYGIIFIFPHEILNIIIILIFSLIMLSISFKLLKSIYNNGVINLRVFFKKIFIIYIFAILGTIITCLLEVYLNTFLLGFFF